MSTKEGPKRRNRLVYYSPFAFYRPHYVVFELLCSEYNLDGFVITHENADVWRVYSPEGRLTPASAGLCDVPNFVTILSANLSRNEQAGLLRRKLAEIRPDFVWSDQEPNDYFVNRILRWYYWRKSPRILIGAIENMWYIPGGNRAKIQLLRRRLLWRRFDGVLAVATKSLESARQFGVPESVPGRVAWLPVLPPENRNGVPPSAPSKAKDDFLVYFAGRITAGKGWRVLLAAMTMLPERFKCMIAGGGEEESELRLWCETTSLRGRVYFLGLLPSEEVRSLYAIADLFVLPSLTTPRWSEQFGRVLAEAMACGVPVIGSSSGAIPEVIGDCGIVVEANNPSALTKAIADLATDSQLRTSLAKKGQQRYQRYFSCQAYAAHVADAFGIRL